MRSEELQRAFDFYGQRERRFGRTGEQVGAAPDLVDEAHRGAALHDLMGTQLRPVREVRDPLPGPVEVAREDLAGVTFDQLTVPTPIQQRAHFAAQNQSL